MVKKAFESFCLLAVLTLALSPTGRAQEKHWLVGVWKGEIADFKGTGGPARTMNVVEVTVDGTAQAAWDTVSATNVGNAKVEVSGDTVTVTPTPNTRADL